MQNISSNASFIMDLYRLPFPSSLFYEYLHTILWSKVQHSLKHESAEHIMQEEATI